MAPWSDRSGRFSPSKTAVFVLLFVPGVWIGVDFLTDNLGPRPLNEAIHQIGLWTIRLLMISLAITPLRQVWQAPKLVNLRRMIGVAAFAYAFIHLVVYFASIAFKLEMLVVEIAVRIYLTIGFAALLILTALAITSTDGMTRRLGGKRWRRIHQWVYPAAILAVVHHFMQVKADLTEPLLMAGTLGWLLCYRLMMRKRSGGKAPSPLALVALTLGVGVVLVAGETGYYMYKFNAPVLRVLAMNLDFALGARPVWWVVGVGLLVVLIGIGRRHRAASQPPASRRPAKRRRASADEAQRAEA